jgi:cytochrome c biogenesis protein CcmG/thiol:disulfide interchange protein DsbE
MFRLTRFAIPAVVFLIMIFFLWRGLNVDPHLIPSVLINQPVPKFSLPTLENPAQKLTEKAFYGQVSILNVWASWCNACREEHEYLLRLSHEPGVILYGFNYKDDAALAKKWLQKLGNPYKSIAVDSDGKTAIDFGIYVTPETFIIDQQGKIRYRRVGAINDTVMQYEIKPIIKRLQGVKIT